jgi:hypothetical protein
MWEQSEVIYIVDLGQLYYLVTKGCQFVFVNGDLAPWRLSVQSSKFTDFFPTGTGMEGKVPRKTLWGRD